MKYAILCSIALLISCETVKSNYSKKSESKEESSNESNDSLDAYFSDITGDVETIKCKASLPDGNISFEYRASFTSSNEFLDSKILCETNIDYTHAKLKDNSMCEVKTDSGYYTFEVDKNLGPILFFEDFEENMQEITSFECE